MLVRRIVIYGTQQLFEMPSLLKCAAAVLAILIIWPGGGHAQGIGWPEAVTRLAAERTKATTCVALLKKHGEPTAVSKGALSYANAKAEIDGVISGLIVAIAQEDDPQTLPDLEARLKRGVAGRRAFCAAVEPLLEREPGQKNIFVAILKETIGPLIEAIKDIYLNHRKEEALEIKTIQTQLEAALWPAFSDIKATQ